MADKEENMRPKLVERSRELLERRLFHHLQVDAGRGGRELLANRGNVVARERCRVGDLAPQLQSVPGGLAP